LAFFGATHGHFAGVTFISAFRNSGLKFMFEAETFEINSPLQNVIHGLNAFQPDVLSGYATGLKILGERQVQGDLKISPEMLISSGEPLNRNQRAVIESAFLAPLLNTYMCTEHIYLGSCRPDFHGMYLLENELIFECREDHTCVSNLFNYTMPLIRYRMEDVLKPIEDVDHVFPFIKVNEVVGRNEFVPYFTNRHGEDDFISPHIINEFYVKNLKRFQLQVVDKQSFVFKVVADAGLTEKEQSAMLDEIRKGLLQILTEKDMNNVSFEISKVDDLPVDPKTGKFKLILPQHASP
jgi:phenylacetate-coenzyme A ligase PaaK-like adenylate-forming protein